MTTDQAVRTPDVDRGLLDVLLAYKRTLTDDQIASMLEHIHPVVRSDGELYYIRPIDPRNVSFIWDPTTTKVATDLNEITKIFSLHTWGYYGMFKPSVEEVLSMIPQHMIDKVRAFEIVGPEDVDDLNRQYEAVDAGYHVAVVILYG